MHNSYYEYYKNQAGGFSPFQGYQYQRGHGFFGSLFQNVLKPLGAYLGKQLIKTGVNVGSDILQGDNLKESLLRNAKMTSKNILTDGINRASMYAQEGSGKRLKKKRSRRKKKKMNKKTKPKKKRLVSKKRPSRKLKRASKFANIF